MKLASLMALAICLSLATAGAGLAQAPARDDRGGCLTECSPRFGIVSEFGEEADMLLADTQNKATYVINGNTFTTGDLAGNRVVIVLTGVSLQNGPC